MSAEKPNLNFESGEMATKELIQQLVEQGGADPNKIREMISKLPDEQFTFQEIASLGYKLIEDDLRQGGGMAVEILNKFDVGTGSGAELVKRIQKELTPESKEARLASEFFDKCVQL